MCSSPYWQVGQSWFREKLSPANREQKLSRWADFAKNCLLRIGSKVLPRFREKYRALGRQKNGVQHGTAIYPIPRYTRPRYIGLTLYRGVTINRNIEKSYHNCLRYAYRIAGAWIDTNDTCSSGKNQTESHTGTDFEYNTSTWKHQCNKHLKTKTV